MRARLLAVPNLVVWVGLAVSAIGIVLIAIAWGGAAGQTDVARGLPYIASAGLPGLALVAIGGLIVALHFQLEASKTRLAFLSELVISDGAERGEESHVRVWDRGVALFGGLIAAGFVAFGITWIAVAPTLRIDAQVAALISGGGGGLALVVLGSVLLHVQVGRRLAAREQIVMERVLDR